MDLEQRIGRIHRYGQQSTAQVYNLVAADTIEGRIFLLLEEKLHDIATTLGKVDDQGQVAEDLRAQVLGQLSSCLSYDRLYQDALSDPTLKRTRQELEVAITNANLARQVVFELFQDLDRFNLGDYRKFDDEGRGMNRLITFLARAARLSGQEFRREDETRWCLIRDGQASLQFTSERDRALKEEELELLGLEHPIIRAHMQRCLSLDDFSRAAVGRIDGFSERGLLTIWKIHTNTQDGQSSRHIIRIGMTQDGERAPWLERLHKELLAVTPPAAGEKADWHAFALQYKACIRELLHRELVYSGIITTEMSYSATLLAVFGLANRGLELD